MKVSGEILLNGEPVSGKLFKKYTAYVMQQDLHFQTLTPRLHTLTLVSIFESKYFSFLTREALTFAAKLKLPRSASPEEIQSKVNAIIEVFSIINTELRMFM